MQGSAAPSILGCFGGIDVCVQETGSIQMQHSESGYGYGSYSSCSSSTSLGLSTYGKLQTLHEEDEECEDDESWELESNNNNNNNNNNRSTTVGARESRRWAARKTRARRSHLVRRDRNRDVHEKRTLLMRWQEDKVQEELELGTVDDGGGGMGMRSNRLGVVKSKLKSSTRLVADKLKRACEHLVKLAQRTTPHMADLFLSNNQLLLHLTGGGGSGGGGGGGASAPHSPPLPRFPPPTEQNQHHPSYCYYYR